MWENTTPTELPRDFCAGIGPLQLGVVLVFYFFKMIFSHFHLTSSFRSSDKQTRTSYEFGCTLQVIQAAEEFLVFIGWGWPKYSFIPNIRGTWNIRGRWTNRLKLI